MKYLFVWSRMSLFVLLLIAIGLWANSAEAGDPLPSWNEGTTKQSIIDFVNRVTQPGSPNFVVPEQRIATFDNDGTLWSEQPMYFQLFFVIDRVPGSLCDSLAWRHQARHDHQRHGSA